MPKLSAAVLSSLIKLGSDIRIARLNRNITMQDMADRVGITRATLKKVEEGKHTVSIGTYAIILLVLGKLYDFTDVMDISKDREFLDRLKFSKKRARKRK